MEEREVQAEGILNVKFSKLGQTTVKAVNIKAKLKQSTREHTEAHNKCRKTDILPYTKWLFNF